jgi:hypothetical protein
MEELKERVCKYYDSNVYIANSKKHEKESCKAE